VKQQAGDERLDTRPADVRQLLEMTKQLVK
jgi:hypothetical protein